MEIWSIQTIHCLNLTAERQKRPAFTNDVNVNFLFQKVVMSIKNKLYRNSILFDYPWHVCNGICNTIDTNSILPSVCLNLKWSTMI